MLLRALCKLCKGFQFKYPFYTNIANIVSAAFADDLLIITDDVEDANKAMRVVEDFDAQMGNASPPLKA